MANGCQTMVRTVRMADLKITPWKNGGGVTREIAALRIGGVLAWRLSMADVASDGPFSNFTGLARILTVLEGNGMDLNSPNGSLAALYGAPVRFDGGLSVECRLRDGPVRDLNLMFDPMICAGGVTRAPGPMRQVLQAGPSQTIGIFGLRGTSSIDGSTALFAGDTALFETGSAELSVPEGAEALLITLALADQIDANSSDMAAR